MRWTDQLQSSRKTDEWKTLSVNPAVNGTCLELENTAAKEGLTLPFICFDQNTVGFYPHCPYDY